MRWRWRPRGALVPGRARARFAAGLFLVDVVTEASSTRAGTGLERGSPPAMAEMVTKTVALSEAFSQWCVFRLATTPPQVWEAGNA